MLNVCILIYIISAIIFPFQTFMNILPFGSNQNHSQGLKSQAVMHSPSYTNTAQTLCSTLNKSADTFMTQGKRQSQKPSVKKEQKSSNQKEHNQQTEEFHCNPFVSIDSIQWGNHKGLFTSELQLKVQYSVTRQLEENVCWKVIYLGSAFSERYDQVLCQFQTEEDQRAHSYPEKRQFKLTVEPPKWNSISQNELFNVTAIVVSVSYKQQEFIKVGYYVHYQLPPLNKTEKRCVQKLGSATQASKQQDKGGIISKTKRIFKKPQKTTKPKPEHLHRQTQGNIIGAVLHKTIRTILTDKPRVTNFAINWQKVTNKSQQFKSQTQSMFFTISQNQHLITEYLRPQTIKASSSGIQC